MDKVIVSTIIILALGGIFALFYILNKKTPKPEGCEVDDSQCESCPITTCLKNIDKEKN